MDREEMKRRLEAGEAPLEVSIAKWREVLEKVKTADCEHEGVKTLNERALSPENCALCYANGFSAATNCPGDKCLISVHTKEHRCKGTPYHYINRKYENKEYSDLSEIIADVEAEIEFLESLRELESKPYDGPVRVGQVFKRNEGMFSEREYKVIQIEGGFQLIDKKGGLWPDDTLSLKEMRDELHETNGDIHWVIVEDAPCTKEAGEPDIFLKEYDAGGYLELSRNAHFPVVDDHCYLFVVVSKDNNSLLLDDDYEYELSDTTGEGCKQKLKVKLRK